MISFISEKLKKKVESLRARLMVNPFLTALCFVLIVWMVVAAVEVHVEIPAKDHNINNVEDAIWWGIVTLLTVGYGDRFPVTTTGRVFAGFLMITGVVGIAIITANVPRLSGLIMPVNGCAFP